MKKMILIVLFVLLILALPTVSAQTEVTSGDGQAIPLNGYPEGFAWSIVAFIIYSFAGFFASGEEFKPIKMAKTFMFVLLVTVFAVGYGITPVQVLNSYGPIIDALIVIFLNTGPIVLLAYLFDKGYKILMLIKTKITT